MHEDLDDEPRWADDPYLPEGFEPGPAMFVETEDGFELTDAAREILAVMDAADAAMCAPPPTALDRLARLRERAAELAAELPEVVRTLEPHDLLDAAVVMQETSNLLDACDTAVVAEIDRQGVHESSGFTSPAQLLADRLRIRPAEAKRRLVVARSCAPRVSLDAQVLPPTCPHVAAALGSGAISADHAAVIAHAVNALPVGLPVEMVDAAEQALVQLARSRNPSEVAATGRDIRDRLDTDGTEPRDQQQRRRRDLSVYQRDDGMGVVRGLLTPEVLAQVMTVLTALAAPQPTDGNGDDTRSPGARMHDALGDVCARLLRSGTLPDTGGVPTTVTVTIPVGDLQQMTAHLRGTTGNDTDRAPAGDGSRHVGGLPRVTTTLGVDLSARQFLHLACEANIIPVVLNDAGGILNHGRRKRLATAAQTRALRARDHGCSFPGCTRPPEWCERHHIITWLLDGDTDIDNLTLLCGHHHRNFDSWGWRVEMRDGVPWWIPPTHLDPEQKPLQNTARREKIVLCPPTTTRTG